MGLISRVSSRTYRKFEKMLQFSKKLNLKNSYKRLRRTTCIKSDKLAQNSSIISDYLNKETNIENLDEILAEIKDDPVYSSPFEFDISKSYQKPHIVRKDNSLGHLHWQPPLEITKIDIPKFEENDEIDFDMAVASLLPKAFIPPMPTKIGVTWSPPKPNLTSHLPYHIARGKFHTIEETIFEAEKLLNHSDVLQVWRFPEEPILRTTVVSNISGDFDSAKKEITRALILEYKRLNDNKQHIAIKIDEENNSIVCQGH